MSRYAIRHEHLGAWPVVALIDSATGASVRIARRGATLLEYLVPAGGQLRNIADGYATAAQLERRHGSRFAVMLPFANRIAGARYRFAGVEHDVAPGVAGRKRSIMHGFVRDADFELAAVDADAAGACVRLGCNAIDAAFHAGYPFALELEVAFMLHAGGLDVTATMRNVGDAAAPCFFGWHPYLRLREDGIDACELRLPARKAIVTNAALIPVAGKAAYKPLDACPELDFRAWRALGASVLDNAFADARPDADGRIRSRLRDPDSGLAVAIWQTHGTTVVFTGDTLGAAAARRSVAIEPVEAMTNAYNRADCAAAITLAPGAERRFECGLEVDVP